MIITDDGYSLQYEMRKNKITVLLPQTVYTLTDTYALTDTVNPIYVLLDDMEEEKE